MNREDFIALSELRQKEAETLLSSALYHGSYYLAGYSVECAVKACICKQTQAYDFPDKKLADQAWQHDLKSLIAVAGLATEFQDARNADKRLEVNWAIVRTWTAEKRYELNVSRSLAEDFHAACARKSGILPWVRARW